MTTKILIDTAVVSQALDYIKLKEPYCDGTHEDCMTCSLITNLRTAISEASKVEPVKFLVNGTRYKVSRDCYHGTGCQILGLPDELQGEWVALVEATDNCHMKLTHPAPAVPQINQEYVERALHYPECWDDVNYPTVWDALLEVCAWFKCGNQDTHPAPAVPVQFTVAPRLTEYELNNPAPAVPEDQLRAENQKLRDALNAIINHAPGSAHRIARMALG